MAPHNVLSWITIVSTLFLLISCSNEVSPNKEMIDLLSAIDKSGYNPKNAFNAEAKLNYYDSLFKTAKDKDGADTLENLVALTLLELGNEEKAVETGEDLIRKIPVYEIEKRKVAMKTLALAYLRLGERINCIKDHSVESCIFPIAGRGVHADKTSSGKAIELYQQILSNDQADLESRWLLNIAYMTIGGYPDQVPAL